MKIILRIIIFTYKAKIKIRVSSEHQKQDLELTTWTRNWLHILFPSWRSCFTLSESNTYMCNINKPNIQKVFNNKFADVFQKDGNAVIRSYKAEITLSDDAYPIFCKPNVFPYGLRSNMEEQLKRFCDVQIYFWTSFHYSNCLSTIAGYFWGQERCPTRGGKSIAAMGNNFIYVWLWNML